MIKLFSGSPFRSKGGLITLLIFLSFVLTSNCISKTSKDYFERIAMVSDGRLTRFTELPITVYVEGLETVGKEYAADFRYALEEWEVVSDGLIKFQLINSSDKANISVSWVKELDTMEEEHPLGVSELQRTSDDEFSVDMRIALRERTTHKLLDHDQMKTVFLHEFGHALGLWGHSKDKSDVMYYAADALRLTKSDTNTLKMVYSHENNYSLHAESISEIRKEMRSKLEDARLYFLLGTVYSDQGDYDLAIDNFKSALHINPKLYKASSALALAYRKSGQEEAAIEEYLSLAESEPSAMVHNIIAALYFEKEDTARTIQHFKKALELDRTYQPAKKNLSKVYIARGKELVNAEKYQAAIELLLDGVEFFPDSPELLNSLGTAYAGARQFQKAIDEYSKALQINPGFTLARTNLASSYNNQGVRYAEAESWEDSIYSYNRALMLVPDMEAAKKNLSAAYWNQAADYSKLGQNRKSVEAYKRYLEYEPNSKEAYNNLGAVYFRMDDYQSAMQAFENAIRIDPADEGLKTNLAIAYHKQGLDMIEKGSLSKAVEILKKGLKIDADNIGLHLALAQAYQRLGSWKEAEYYVTKALELEPKKESARKMLMALNIHHANDLLQSKRYDQALEYYQKVPPDLTPPSLYNNIGYIYIMKKMDMEAIAEFDKVLAAEPTNEIAHKNLLTIESRFLQDVSRMPRSQKNRDKLARVRLSLAMSHAGRGSLNEAKITIKSAIDANPGDVNVRRSLATFCRNLADVFTKKGKERGEVRELTTWAAQLERR